MEVLVGPVQAEVHRELERVALAESHLEHVALSDAHKKSKTSVLALPRQLAQGVG